MIPTDDMIINLHKKYAPSRAAFDLIFMHCQIVWEAAEQLIKQASLRVDPKVVKAGCLLHDIGVYPLYLPDGTIDHANYIKHGTNGHNILKQEGFDERFCHFASHHTGVGLTKDEIMKNNLPIPPADYFALTLEEQLIMYADKFHTKTTPPTLMTPDAYAQFVSKFGEDKVTRFRQFQEMFGVPDLHSIAKKYNLAIV